MNFIKKLKLYLRLLAFQKNIKKKRYTRKDLDENETNFSYWTKNSIKKSKNDKLTNLEDIK